MIPFKILIAISPLALLGACGGPANDETTSPSMPAESTAPATPAASDIRPATPVAPAAPESAPAAPAQASAAASPSAPTTLAPASAAAPQTAKVAASAPSAFTTCRACHAVEAGKNLVGPSLAGIVGSKAGAVPGYAFSPALKASGLVWTEDTLDTWLQGPARMVPGTKMMIGVPDPAARKAVIDYLKTL